MKSRYLLAALFALMPLSAVAADYTINFGEVRGKPEVVTPMQTIKMCIDTSGYFFGYDLIPSLGGSYTLKTVFHLPATPKTIAKDVKSENYGHDLTVDSGTQNGRYLQSFFFDEGDPLGAWSLDVVINDAVVKNIPFNVVAASSCP